MCVGRITWSERGRLCSFQCCFCAEVFAACHLVTLRVAFGLRLEMRRSSWRSLTLLRYHRLQSLIRSHQERDPCDLRCNLVAPLAFAQRGSGSPPAQDYGWKYQTNSTSYSPLLPLRSYGFIERDNGGRSVRGNGTSPVSGAGQVCEQCRDASTGLDHVCGWHRYVCGSKAAMGPERVLFRMQMSTGSRQRMPKHVSASAAFHVEGRDS